MESVAGGDGSAVASLRPPDDACLARRDVCDAHDEVMMTLKSRTVWFPVLHGRGFL